MIKANGNRRKMSAVKGLLLPNINSELLSISKERFPAIVVSNPYAVASDVILSNGTKASILAQIFQ